MTVWLLLALWGCKDKREPDILFEFPDEPAVEASLPSGQLLDGRFVDDEYGLSIAVPEGWAAEPGAADDALRLRLRHGPTGALIELWAFSARLTEPAPRPDCAWDFRDGGAYRTLPTAELLMVATCRPTEPTEPRVLAWLTVRGGMTWQVELHTPAEQMAPAREAGEAVLRTVRF